MFEGKDQSNVYIYEVGHKCMHVLIYIPGGQRVIYHSLENCTSYIMAIENDYVDIDYKSNVHALEKGEVDNSSLKCVYHELSNYAGKNTYIVSCGRFLLRLHINSGF